MEILVIEDDDISRKVLSTILEEYGQVESAEDGLDGIEKFEKKIAENSNFNLICIDIMMPGLNGIKTLKKIRELEGRAGFTDMTRSKVIMITALENNNAINDSFKTECDSYLIKPVNSVKIKEILRYLNLIV